MVKLMWVYFFIFFAKIVEVTLATLRIMLVNRGEKIKGACIGFFEVMLWVIVVSQVLDGVSEDPIKLLVYCLAFALGNYIGVTIENKLAIGTACIQAVVAQDKQPELSDALREKGFGVTHIQGAGKDGPVQVLMIYLKRKCLDEATTLIRSYSPHALITVNDVRQLRNGYIRK